MHSYIRLALSLSVSFLFRFGYNIKGNKCHKIGNVVDTHKLALILIISKWMYTHGRAQLVTFSHSAWAWMCTVRCAHTTGHKWAHIAIWYTVTIIEPNPNFILFECASYVANDSWVAWNRVWRPKEWNWSGHEGWNRAQMGCLVESEQYYSLYVNVEPSGMRKPFCNDFFLFILLPISHRGAIINTQW